MAKCDCLNKLADILDDWEKGPSRSGRDGLAARIRASISSVETYGTFKVGDTVDGGCDGVFEVCSRDEFKKEWPLLYLEGSVPLRSIVDQNCFKKGWIGYCPIGVCNAIPDPRKTKFEPGTLVKEHGDIFVSDKDGKKRSIYDGRLYGSFSKDAIEATVDDILAMLKNFPGLCEIIFRSLFRDKYRS